jgi:proton-translocating NADH-quinone oxidoreductase chain N
MNANVAFYAMILIPLASAPLVYLAGRIQVRQDKKPWLSRWLSIFSLLAAGIGLYFAAQGLMTGLTPTVKIGSIELALDGIGQLLAAVVIVLGLLAVLFSSTYMAGEEGEEKFYALLTAMIGTILGLGCTRDLFNLWVWFEAMAITSYMLVAFYRLQPASLEAGVKYLVQSATGSVMVILGIALVLGRTGTLELAEIHAAAQSGDVWLLAAGALFLVGFGVKVALVPLHTWLPDAHSQAPSGISAMLSGIVIEAGLVAMLRALGALTEVSQVWGGLLMGAGALNMLVGNLMALRQQQIKRLLAYSSLSHVGYMLVGLGLAVTYGVQSGANGAFFHLFNHAMMKGLAFFAVGALMYGMLISRGVHKALEVKDLDGISRRYPGTAFVLSVALLSLGGLPPLAGFMSKWPIFIAGFQSRDWVGISLVIFAALNSVLSLGYYAPLVNRIYRHQPGELALQGERLSLSMTIPLVLAGAIIVVLGFWPSLLNCLFDPAAASLMSLFGQ